MRFLPSREILNSRATGFMSGTVWHFGHLKIWFFKGHESLQSKASCFRCLTLRRFEDLKMWFFKFPKTLSSRLCGYRYAHFGHFGGLKMWFLEGRETLSSRNRASSECHYSILATGKCYYSSFIDPRPIGIYHPQSLYSAFWRPEMRFIKCHETLRWRILGFCWATFKLFGGLKKRFQPCR
jgi:hypothetical protein